MVISQFDLLILDLGLPNMHGLEILKRLRARGSQLPVLVLTAADSVEELVGKLAKPRVAWIMVPAGDATEEQIRELLEHLEPGDTIVDGGNSNFRDSMRRAGQAKAKGVSFLDAGVSGGIWGLTEGYCIMAGGDKAAARARSRSRTLFVSF